MNRFVCITAVLALATMASAQAPEITPWAKAGKGMDVVQKGFWNVIQDKKKTKFWVEIPGARLKKPFLMATSISGGTTQRGWQWNDWLLVFQLHGKKLVLIERKVGIVTQKGSAEKKAAIKDTYRDRVITTYPIRAKGPNGGYVIDGRSFFASGAPTFFGSIGRSKDVSLAKFDGTKPFDKNLEVRVTMPRIGSGTLITLSYSISGLPTARYKPRLADDRIGYFTTTLKDFSDDNKDENRYIRYINRWKLDRPKDPKLKKEEPTDPQEPIIFYIEKTVPLHLRRAVREGILEWNKAFEKTGFYNAIVVRQQTKTRFAELDPEDVRYNFFRWIYSESAFAMGPSRVDPRTGRILDADIIFDDEYVRYTLMQEYRMMLKEIPATMIGHRDREILKHHPFARLGIVAAADEFATAVPADAAKPNWKPWSQRAFCSIGRGVRHQLGCCSLHFKDAGPNGTVPRELIAQFVKDTVMHEVGHTLGLRHNFKASIYRSYNEINSEAKPGDITGSVMDYNPIIIAPEGKPQGNYAMRTIGPYDYWAIEYGYTSDEKKVKAVGDRVAEKGLDYATDEDTWSDDPYVARWDMGSDPLNFAKERVALMMRLRKNLEARAVDKGERFNRLRRAMNMQFYEARSAASIAVRHIGGEHMHRDHRGDKNARPALVPVAAAKQREALNFVCDEILSGKFFEFEPELLQKLAPDYWGDDFFAFFFEGHGYSYLDNVRNVQLQVVYALTSSSRLNRVLDTRYKTTNGGDLVTAPEIFDALEKTIFGDLNAKLEAASSDKQPALSDMQRALQREYISHLIYILLDGEQWYPAQIQTLVRHYVKRLGETTKNASSAAKDTYTKAHLEECAARLQRALDASYTLNR